MQLLESFNQSESVKSFLRQITNVKQQAQAGGALLISHLRALSRLCAALESCPSKTSCSPGLAASLLISSGLWALCDLHALHMSGHQIQCMAPSCSKLGGACLLTFPVHCDMHTRRYEGMMHAHSHTTALVRGMPGCPIVSSNQSQRC